MVAGSARGAAPDGHDVVVGAGLCGLATALTLARNGRRCLLVEREAAVGGLARSFDLDGVTFDLGPHMLYDKDQSRGAVLLREALGDAAVVKRPFRYAIVGGGRNFKMPIVFDLLAYPLRYKLEIAGRLLRRVPAGAPTESIRVSIESRFGASFYREVFGPMIRKKTGRPGDEVHVEWFIRPPRDARNRKKPPPPRHVRNFLEPLKNFFSLRDYVYPAAGFGEYARGLHRAYEAAGGKTLLGCRDLELSLAPGSVAGLRAGGADYPVRNLVWTGSVNELNRRLGAGAASADYVTTRLVFLTYGGKRPDRHAYAYVYHPQDDLIFVRAYYPDNLLGPERTPDREGVCLEINSHPGIERMSEGEIVDACVRDLERLGIFPARALRAQRLLALTDGMPVYGIDYERTMGALFAPARQYANLLAVGRTGGYCFCMSPAAVEQGLDAADFLMAR
jgi:protoporphyrinogen oxidase